MLDENITRFQGIQMRAMLAGADTQFDATLVRTVDGTDYTGQCTLGVRRGVGASSPLFGIVPSLSMTVAEDPDRITGSPLKAGDRLIRLNGIAVEHQWDIDRICKTLDGSPVTVTVQRGPGEDPAEETVTVRPAIALKNDVNFRSDGTRLLGWTLCDVPGEDPTELQTPDGKTVEVAGSDVALLSPARAVEIVPRSELADEQCRSMLDVVGLLPRMQIISVLRGSPADKAGVRPGDIVLYYGDVPTPTVGEFLEINKKRKGQQTGLTVLRDGQRVTMDITPAVKDDQAIVGIMHMADLGHLAVAKRPPRLAGGQGGHRPRRRSDHHRRQRHSRSIRGPN